MTNRVGRNALLGMGLLLASCGQPTTSSFTVTNGYAVDGDTFHTAGTRVRYRLSAIDAPELPGHCTGYRATHSSCAPGDPYRARDALQTLLDTEPTCQDHGPDYYQRRLVTCQLSNGEDIGQLLVASGNAVPYIYQGHRS